MTAWLKRAVSSGDQAFKTLTVFPVQLARLIAEHSLQGRIGEQDGLVRGREQCPFRHVLQYQRVHLQRLLSAFALRDVQGHDQQVRLPVADKRSQMAVQRYGFAEVGGGDNLARPGLPLA